MTTLDDPDFLIQHIRSCFITSDDSGLCELLVEPDFRRQALRDRSGSKNTNASSDSESNNELSISPDIHPDQDYTGGNRLRSNTAMRIDKIKQEKAERSKIKSVKWSEMDKQTRDESSVTEYFPVKPISNKRKKSEPSALSQLIQSHEESNKNSSNPFNEYKQYDGASHVESSGGSKTKTIRIYYHINISDDTHVYPICVISSATVRQTMGLSLYKLVEKANQQNIDVSELQPDISAYSLHMLEDDGEIDDDFPALAPDEPISKFGFPRLALVCDAPPPPSPQQVRHVNQKTREAEDQPASQPLLVTVNLPDLGFSKFLLEAEQTVGELLEMVLIKRNIATELHSKHTLEHSSQSGVPLDKGTLVNTLPTREFNLLLLATLRNKPGLSRASSMYIEQSMEDAGGVIGGTISRYYVNLSTGARVFNSHTPSTLCILGERVEIIPTNPGKRVFNTQKSIVISNRSILACSLSKTKSRGKSAVTLHYNPNYSINQSTLSNVTFEADEQAAPEIMNLINDLIDENPQPSLDKNVKPVKKRRQSSLY